MILHRISREFQNPKLHSLYPKLFSSSSISFSKLKEYDFSPPEHLSVKPNSIKPNDCEKPKSKKQKPLYKPPSSLDTSEFKPLHSDLSFDFRFSYTESSPDVRPIGLREPKYSPFGPSRIDRVWTGVCAPVVDPIVKSVDDGNEEGVNLEEKRKKLRDDILGKPLTDAERKILLDKCQRVRTKRQINLGRDGFTHNILNDIHNNWKTCEAVRIRCLGVPTVDMKNVCNQLEYVNRIRQVVRLYKHGGLLVLYRGRHYKPKERPVIPVMLWRPHEPIYLRLIRSTIDGLTIDETKEMRKRGLSVPALAKLVKNGYYGNLVPMVRDAFLTEEMVRIDCKGLNKSDYKKIGYKLRDLVPCILVTFKKEQIVIWRGENYTTPEPGQFINDDNSFDYLVGGSSHTVEEDGSSSNDYESSSFEDVFRQQIICTTY
ncbi:hypothetical protein MKX03_012377 [Papaver bracteatum]|nr:hypothetical protein MKX03_012377 [Papaver bracteatum]